MGPLICVLCGEIHYFVCPFQSVSIIGFHCVSVGLHSCEVQQQVDHLHACIFTERVNSLFYGLSLCITYCEIIVLLEILSKSIAYIYTYPWHFICIVHTYVCTYVHTYVRTYLRIYVRMYARTVLTVHTYIRMN